MPRKPDPTLKPAIVAKVAQHLQDTKIEDVSVRSLGRVLGTSAYPIVYHFGSRESLIQAVVDHLSSTVSTTPLDPAADDAALSEYLVAVFGGLDDPERALAARLTFELGSVESLDGRDRERTFHRAQIAAIAAWCSARGAHPADAERVARDAVLSARGVQWGAVVDRARSDVDAELRRIAGGLVAAVGVATV
ncbi:TetR/AcrR family transcriptional regulator [Curtobacterium sp. MCPF17_002]|uniref:TetR/AcrR family transcriptional regulator n=1 Tax=Curtobacterium sp. MCPF17_002 TaxID=2175645 RepID=UPI000DA78AFB|nr:TetR/AcrR family transcriptional regulator [Curtobacterium sp. MCPF17_002]WIB76537.1 TetR/AcrR family transcriptional regulator [Curtobacterium sp. MCPF17_002]